MKINGKEFDFKITNIRHAAAYEKALGNMQEKEAAAPSGPSEAERILLDTDADNLTPMQALTLVSDLAERVKGKYNGKDQHS